MDRRVFLAGMAATAALAACGLPPLPPGLPDGAVPTKETIYGWIQHVFNQGIRRPAYPADVVVTQWAKDRFEEFGLENVRLEPITVRRWTPNEWSLVATPDGGTARTLECFPAPYSAPVTDLTVELAAYNAATPSLVAGKASLYDVNLLTLPATFFVTQGSVPVPPDPGRIVDPNLTFNAETHTLPFSLDLLNVMEPSVAAGAVAFIGGLTNYPGDSFEYFVPYDAIDRPIPGVWIRGSDADWLHQQLLLGSVSVCLNIDSMVEEVESYNLVGELPGADEEWVIIGSHHDGPWSSAVEDGSGISLVLAQAKFWSQVVQAERPHRLVFLLQGGHLSGGAGLNQFIDAHQAELDNVVLEVHLEHVARKFEENLAGELVDAGMCVPRWWFVSRNPTLENTVKAALNTEKVYRSMLLAPNAIGTQPPTDGAFYHTEGVPIVHHLAAPFYLFDAMDTLDKIDQESLVGITRATIRIVDSTTGVSAAAMRAGVVA
jgi:hypothetical protein